MSPIRSNRSADAISVFRRSLLIGVSGLFSIGCGPGEPSHSASHRNAERAFDINLMVYALGPRETREAGVDGTAVDALVEVVRAINPDVLAVLQTGSMETFEAIRETLRRSGADFQDVEFVRAASPGRGLAVLSRLPIVARRSQTNLTYRIGDHTLPLEHGILDVTVVAGNRYPLRVLLVELKDKTFHRHGQTEMRRNESRLVARHVRGLLAGAEENLIVVGSLNDIPGSAPVRELVDDRTFRLHDLRPIDEFGYAWTLYDEDQDACLRHDYALASASLLPAVDPDRTRILNRNLSRAFSPHRPLVIGLNMDQAANRPP